MAVIGFKERITDLAGSLGTADDNALQQWVLDGCYDVIGKLQLSGMNVAPARFAISSSSYNSAMSVDLSEVREVLSAERDGFTCRPVSFTQSKFVDPNTTLGADSIYKATSSDPVYYIKDGQLIIKPNPTESELGYYSYIPEYSLSGWDTSSTTIANFPSQYYEHVILYTAIAVLDRQLLDLLTNTDITAAITAAKDAITKSSEYMDSTGATTTNVVGWLNDEDSEMAQAVLSAVSGELSTSQASGAEVKLRMQHDLQKYQWQQDRRDNLKREYMSKFPSKQRQKGGQ